MGGVNPFAIDPGNVDKYNFNYQGMEKIDELETFVFDVTPKVIPDPKKSKLRLFTGRIWVEAEDEMIVKTRGKAVPETREQIPDRRDLPREYRREVLVPDLRGDGRRASLRRRHGPQAQDAGQVHQLQVGRTTFDP